MLAYVTRWFSLWASPPVALAFLKDSSVPVSNSRSAWFGVATSGILVFSLLVWVELRLRLAFGSVARHAVGFAANGLRVALAQIGTLHCRDTPARRDFAERLAGLRKDRFCLGQVLDPAQDHVAVGRARSRSRSPRGPARGPRPSWFRSRETDRRPHRRDRRTLSRRTRPARVGTAPSAIPGCSRSSPRSRCWGALLPDVVLRRHRHRAFLPHLRARRSPGARSRSSISGCRASSRSSPPTRDSPPPRGT